MSTNIRILSPSNFLSWSIIIISFFNIVYRRSNTFIILYIASNLPSRSIIIVPFFDNDSISSTDDQILSDLVYSYLVDPTIIIAFLNNNSISSNIFLCARILHVRGARLFSFTFDSVPIHEEHWVRQWFTVSIPSKIESCARRVEL